MSGKGVLNEKSYTWDCGLESTFPDLSFIESERVVPSPKAMLAGFFLGPRFYTTGFLIEQFILCWLWKGSVSGHQEAHRSPCMELT